jgi:hypothetical protein
MNWVVVFQLMDLLSPIETCIEKNLLKEELVGIFQAVNYHRLTQRELEQV